MCRRHQDAMEKRVLLAQQPGGLAIVVPIKQPHLTRFGRPGWLARSGRRAEFDMRITLQPTNFVRVLETTKVCAVAVHRNAGRTGARGAVLTKGGEVNRLLSREWRQSPIGRIGNGA